MSQWGFVAAAYAVALGGTGVLTFASWVAMRKAER